MIASEGRLTANRANAQMSTGPTTRLGKEASRRNGLKHGLAGAGIVTPEGDREEIRARSEALTGDMRPSSPAGAILIVRMATLSVRAERAAEHESAAIARNVRHAADEFDEGRIEEADRRFAALADDPRGNLRGLKKMPEGVDRLIDAWRDLRQDLTADPRPIWAAEQLERAANLTGLKSEHARGSWLGALSRGSWGDFSALGEQDGGLDDEARREWARSRLIERIDAEIAGLEEHDETLDFETIELDRAEAGARALFDVSKPAILARRYEAEASRGFYKALKEFREVEAESEARAESTPARPKAPATVGPGPGMGSCRETPPPPDPGPARAFPEPRSPEFPPLLDADGQPLRPVRPPKTTG
jgi:hypothetical protein